MVIVIELLNNMKKKYHNICGGLLITFFSWTLSPLYIASYGYVLQKNKEKKKLTKLSKKMIKIVSKNPQIGIDFHVEKQCDNEQLFNMIYPKMNDLSVKELKLLRDFLLNGVQYRESKIPFIEYYQYCEEIDCLIEVRTRKNRKNF